ncbi:MAG: FixG Ig-like domain-containing protein, partial [Burkholderiaceae bacterium]
EAKPLPKFAFEELGDCIDCTICVQVCPTGIDIRNGLQNECIACAACIDVCDDVMDKMGYAPGLIRYSSGNAIEKSWSPRQMLARVWRPRVLIYGGLLLAASLTFVISLSTRPGFGVDIIRDRGALARQTGKGQIENVYRLQIRNTTEQAQRFSLKVSGLPGLQLATAAELDVPAIGIASMPVRLTLPPDQADALRGRASPIAFTVSRTDGGDARSSTEASTFFVPR